MKRFLFAALLCSIGHCAYGADTDGDGLLDLIDVPGFNPNASGDVEFYGRNIQDLDGANLLTNATGLILGAGGNRVTSLENGDFHGLSNLQRLDLGENRITSLESGDFQGLDNLKMLNLGLNRIASLESGAFQGLSNLHTLYLHSNRITSLVSGEFQGLSNLQMLELGSNELTSIEDGDFQGLNNLQTLGLGGNQITSLEQGDFQGLGNLQRLNFFGARITSLESGDFQGLSNLQTLDLSGNRITSLENGAFQGLTNLQTLYLGYCADGSEGDVVCFGNQITSLKSGGFQGLGNLQLLSLGGNQITSLENGVFQGLSNLQTLDLRGNQITSIESGAFQGLNNLHTLLLRENNIQKLNLTGATFESLGGCTVPWGIDGFCADGSEITDLILDDAVLSLGSFQAIIAATQLISTASLVGLGFSDTSPDDLSNLLSFERLDHVRVDQALFDQYAAEFNAFDAIAGNTVSVVLTTGDYNRDGTVDAADYVVWRKGLGTTYTQADYDVWRANFGQTVGSGGAGNPLSASAVPLSIAVPEPATLTLLVMATVVYCARRPSSV
jgi:insulin-like growth factor-binding protein complex acid labile subunit